MEKFSLLGGGRLKDEKRTSLWSGCGEVEGVRATHRALPPGEAAPRIIKLALPGIPVFVRDGKIMLKDALGYVKLRWEYSPCSA